MPSETATLQTNALDKLTNILQPQPVPQLRLGHNIAPNGNPDVEVVALTLHSIPLTADAFRDKADGKDFYRFAFMILGVGPPGFSSVPYSSTRNNSKKDSKQPLDCKNLYEDASDAAPLLRKTRFYTFEKGKTNKDRGPRREDVEREKDDNVEQDNSPLNVTAVLQSGLQLACFLRPEDYMAGSRFFVDAPDTLTNQYPDGVLPAFSVVYMQLSSKNVEQAKNGRLLNMKRMKLASNVNDVLAACFPLVPCTDSDFNIANRCEEKYNYAIRENMDKSRTRVFALDPDSRAYVSAEESASVIVHASDEIHEALVSETALQSLLPRAERSDCLKLLNIALACKAVRMLVRSNAVDGISLDCGREAFTHEVVALFLDVNALLSLEQAERACQTGQNGDTDMTGALQPDFVFTQTEAGDVCWTYMQHRVLTAGREWHVGFRVPAQTGYAEAEHGADPDTARFLDKGCGGGFTPLQVVLCQNGNVHEGRTVLDLELRPGQRQTGSKRKRMDLF